MYVTKGQAFRVRGVPGVRGQHVPHNVLPLLGLEPPIISDTPFLQSPTARSIIKPWVLDGFLTDYQTCGINWAAHRSALLEWPPGAGKTLAALCWMAVGGPEGFAIIVTRATTKQQWKREAAQYSEYRPQVLYGQQPHDITSNVVILSWEILPYWIETLQHVAADRARGGSIVSVVMDEIHNAKDWKRTEKYLDARGISRRRERRTHQGILSRAASTVRLSRLAHRRLGLSATPIRNTLADIWPQLDYLEPEQWGSNWEFVHQYCAASPGKWGGLDTSGRSNVDELKKRMSTVIHTVDRLEMARELPPKRRRLLYLGPQEQVRSIGYGKDLRQAAKQGGTKLFEMKLMEASSRKRRWMLDTVVEDIDDGQKIVILTGRRADCDKLGSAIAKKLSKRGTPVFVGHGGTSIRERHAMVETYAKTEDPCVLVGTVDAFGEAIDGLQHTDLVYFVMLPYTPGQVIQAEGRFSRHGSTRPVLITYVVAEGTVDEHVSDILLDKLQTVKVVMDHDEAGEIAGTLQGLGREEEILESIFEAVGV